MYTKILRYQKNKIPEEKVSQLNSLRMNSLMRVPKLESLNTFISSSDECRRGISALSSSNFTVTDCFNMYIEEKNVTENQEYLTFNDFCSLNFHSRYPEIIYDIFYVVCKYKFTKSKEKNEPNYYNLLRKEINKVPIISDKKTLDLRKKVGWRYDEEEISKKINLLK
ncbi:unnamed protein product [Moneuplotes crassus]|uniref:Uncharacterized protein n=1 Tax=Euplotes crassus TaxID=5936 RepID=A0AAD1X306_EUPCR|nr:unnamed protein product [Moneuplotes crassus]